MRTVRSLARFFLALLLFGSCAAPPPAIRGTGRESFAAAPDDRPGLGTRWGETRESPVAVTGFHRASATRPFAVAAIYYNDPNGILAMAGNVKPRRKWPILPSPASSLVSLGLRDQSGRFLPGLIVGDRWFVAGEEGRRYSIVVREQERLAFGSCAFCGRSRRA